MHHFVTFLAGVGLMALFLLWNPRTKLPFALLAVTISVGLLGGTRWMISRVRRRLWPPVAPAAPKQTFMGVVRIKPDIMLSHSNWVRGMEPHV